MADPVLPVNNTPNLATSNIVMMIYRQAVLAMSVACLFFFESPIRASIFSPSKPVPK